MTKAELMEALATVPDDAQLCFPDFTSECCVYPLARVYEREPGQYVVEGDWVHSSPL